jgi:hypothetical protein
MTNRPQLPPFGPEEEAALRRMLFTEDDLRAMMFGGPPQPPSAPQELQGTALERHRARKQAGRALYPLELDCQLVLRALQSSGHLVPDRAGDKRAVRLALEDLVAALLAAQACLGEDAP